MTAVRPALSSEHLHTDSGQTRAVVRTPPHWQRSDPRCRQNTSTLTAAKLSPGRARRQEGPTDWPSTVTSLSLILQRFEPRHRQHIYLLSQSLDRLRDPRAFYSMSIRRFYGGKAAGAQGWPLTSTYSAVVKNEWRCILHLYVFMPFIGTISFLPLPYRHKG